MQQKMTLYKKKACIRIQKISYILKIVDGIGISKKCPGLSRGEYLEV